MLYRLSWLCLAVVLVTSVACNQPTASNDSAVKEAATAEAGGADGPGVAGTNSVESGDAAAESQPSIASEVNVPQLGTSPAEIEAGGMDENGEIVLSSPIEAVPANQGNSAATNSQTQNSDLPADLASVAVAKAPSASSVAGSDAGRKQSTLPDEANVVDEYELNQKIAEDWPTPQAVLFVSGQQHGYLEPCGCTGLERQKGGLIRRDTLLTSLRERGWEVVPVDVGNQVRRIGRQAELKFKATSDAFRTMGYAAATLGIDDLKLSSIELLQVAGGGDDQNPSPFISANLTILDPSFFAASRVVEAGGRKIGITAFLGEEHRQDIQNSDIEFADPVEKLKPVVAQLKEAGCDFVVLLAHASIDESAKVAQQLTGIDLVVTAGGYGEPTFRPEPIEGSNAQMVQVGIKGMHGGIVGLFDDPQNPIRYQRIAISAQFKDSPRMLEQFADYQTRLKEAGFDALGATPRAHNITGRKFVGSEACSDCHSTAYEIWKNSPHYHATESIVHPPNDRGGIERHFDPECVSCHVTGWDPQGFQPFISGYESLEKSELLLGSGCENCHGPGSEHVAAELGEIDVDNEKLVELQQQMVLPLDRARQDKCLECHDLDNSPDFHGQPVDEVFAKYWEQIKHYGKD